MDLDTFKLEEHTFDLDEFAKHIIDSVGTDSDSESSKRIPTFVDFSQDVSKREGEREDYVLSAQGFWKSNGKFNRVPLFPSYFTFMKNMPPGNYLDDIIANVTSGMSDCFYERKRRTPALTGRDIVFSRKGDSIKVFFVRDKVA